MNFKKIFIVLIAIVIAYFGSVTLLKKYSFPYEYKEYVDMYSSEYELDPLLVLSVMKAESDFDKDAVSRSDAKGLMQIMDSTGEWAAEEIGINYFLPTMLFDPELNIRIGCWYLNNLRAEFNDLDLEIAAYNAGRGRVRKWLEDEEYSKDGTSLHYIPFKETKKYVDKVKTNYSIYKYLYKK